MATDGYHRIGTEKWFTAGQNDVADSIVQDLVNNADELIGSAFFRFGRFVSIAPPVVAMEAAQVASLGQFNLGE
jgi:hypothetical protein